MIRLHTLYMPHVRDTPDAMRKRACQALASVEYDTLVGRGLSGALIVPILGRELDCHWMVLRKPNDSAHSSLTAEGTLGDRWVFVDDLIDSGATLRAAVEHVTRLAENCRAWNEQWGGTTFVGAYLYENYGDPRFWHADKLKKRWIENAGESLDTNPCVP